MLEWAFSLRVSENIQIQFILQAWYFLMSCKCFKKWDELEQG